MPNTVLNRLHLLITLTNFNIFLNYKLYFGFRNHLNMNDKTFYFKTSVIQKEYDFMVSSYEMYAAYLCCFKIYILNSETWLLPFVVLSH